MSKSSLSKKLLAAAAALLFCSACARIAFGAYLADKPNEFYQFLNLVSDPELEKSQSSGSSSSGSFGELIRDATFRPGQLEIAGYCLIACGVAAIAAVAFAALAAAAGSVRMVVLLSALLVSMVVLQVTAGILGNGYQQRVNERAVDGWVRLQNDLLVPVFSANFSTDPEASITAAINFIHIKGECCGAKSSQDAAQSPRWQKEVRPLQPLIQLPLSCCAVNAAFRDSFSLQGPWDKLYENIVQPACPVTKDQSLKQPCMEFVKKASGLSDRLMILLITVAVCSLGDILAFAAAIFFFCHGAKRQTF